jgi:hypothetical protein
MSKHTPGPWGLRFVFPEPLLVEDNKGESWHHHEATIVFGDKIIGRDEYMSDVRSGWPRVNYHDEFLANSNLMSAAPEMYEALKKLRSYFGENDKTQAEHVMFEIANKAILKAEGGEHE